MIWHVTLAKEYKQISLQLIFPRLLMPFLTVGFFINFYWYGIRGKVHTWITSFLANRIQSVVVNNSTLSYIPVTFGVPRGPY